MIWLLLLPFLWSCESNAGAHLDLCRDLAKSLAQPDDHSWILCEANQELTVETIAGKPIGFCRCRLPGLDAGAP